MPNQPKTKSRNVRVPDELWDEAKAKAGEKGETVSQVIIRALRNYVARR